jgi:hypothetical protein
LLRDFKADLHLHTCLSPCGDWQMTPRNIIRKSCAAGLQMVAVCDHHSIENTAAVLREGQRWGIPVLPGMEICTREEVHLLALFDGLDRAAAMQEFVYSGLTGENDPEVFGYQIVTNEADEILAENRRFLIGATGFSLAEVVTRTHALGGLVLGAHVDRPVNGIIAQLGFIPPDLGLDAVEVSARIPLSTARQQVPAIGGLPCVTASDAHRLEEIGRAFTVLRLERPAVAELGLAFRAELGRRVVA